MEACDDMKATNIILHIMEKFQKYIFFVWNNFRDAKCHKQGFPWLLWADFRFSNNPLQKNCLNKKFLFFDK